MKYEEAERVWQEADAEYNKLRKELESAKPEFQRVCDEYYCLENKVKEAQDNQQRKNIERVLAFDYAGCKEEMRNSSS